MELVKSATEQAIEANLEANYYDSLRTAECLGDKPAPKRGLVLLLEEGLERILSEKPEIKWNDRPEDLEGA